MTVAAAREQAYIRGSRKNTRSSGRRVRVTVGAFERQQSQQRVRNREKQPDAIPLMRKHTGYWVCKA